MNSLLFFKKIHILKKQKGAVAVLLTIFIVSTILIIGVGLARIFLAEIRMSIHFSESPAAFYAAESGIERGLFEEIKGSGAVSCSDNVGAASYTLTVTRNGDEVVFNSVGSFRQVLRAIEVRSE